MANRNHTDNNMIYYIIISVLCIAIFFLSLSIVIKIFFKSETQKSDFRTYSTVEKQDYQGTVVAFLNINGSKREIKGEAIGVEVQTDEIDNFFLRVLLNSNSYMKLAFNKLNNTKADFGIIRQEVYKFVMGVDAFSYIRTQLPAIMNVVDATKVINSSKINNITKAESNDEKLINSILDKDSIKIKDEDNGLQEGEDTSLVNNNSPEDNAEASEGIYVYEKSLEQAGINIGAFTGLAEASEIASLLRVKPIKVERDKPYILIYHTHGTEAFLHNNDKVFYSTDKKYNVTNIGEIVTNYLIDGGLRAKHVDTYHDVVSFNESYARSLQTARRELNEEKNLKVVFDIHRDGVNPKTADMNLAKKMFKTEINGKSVATFSLVVGPDNPNYDEILRFAQYIKTVSDTMYPGLCRNIIEKPYGKFNQYISDHYALIEVGSNINSVDEAEECARLLSQVLQNAINGIME